MISTIEKWREEAKNLLLESNRNLAIFFEKGSEKDSGTILECSEKTSAARTLLRCAKELENKLKEKKAE